MKDCVIAVLLLCCLTSCITDSSTDSAEPELLAIGTEAPIFTIYTDAYPDGFALSALRGRYVMIEFWASWCPDCRAVTADMKTLYATYGSEEIVFLGVSFDTDIDTWRSYIAENELLWLQHHEETAWKESAVAAAYNVQWIPTFYLIAPDGTIAYDTVDVSQMAERLQELTKE